jgi:hypothetical protein
VLTVASVVAVTAWEGLLVGSNTMFKLALFVQMTISDNLLSSMKIVLNGMGTLRISLANPANKVRV